LPKSIVNAAGDLQLLFPSFAGVNQCQLAMIQPFFYPFLLFADVQLLFRITLLGFALVPDSAGTGVKLAFSYPLLFNLQAL